MRGHRCEALVVWWFCHISTYPKQWSVRGHPVFQCGMAARFLVKVPGQREALVCHHHSRLLKQRRPDARVDRVTIREVE